MTGADRLEGISRPVETRQIDPNPLETQKTRPKTRESIIIYHHFSSFWTLGEWNARLNKPRVVTPAQGGMTAVAGIIYLSKNAGILGQKENGNNKLK